MEPGYTTLDLAMLLIASFVIWAASRFPRKNASVVKTYSSARIKRKHRQRNSFLLK